MTNQDIIKAAIIIALAKFADDRAKEDAEVARLEGLIAAKKKRGCASLYKSIKSQALKTEATEDCIAALTAYQAGEGEHFETLAAKFDKYIGYAEGDVEGVAGYMHSNVLPAIRGF